MLNGAGLVALFSYSIDLAPSACIVKMCILISLGETLLLPTKLEPVLFIVSAWSKVVLILLSSCWAVAGICFYEVCYG